MTILSLTLALLGLRATPSRGAALTLDEAYLRAAESEPSLVEAAASFQAARERYAASVAQLMPTLTGQAFVGHQASSPLPGVPASYTNYSQGGYGLTLGVPLLNVTAFRDSERLRTSAQRYEVGTEGARQDLMLLVAEAFVGALDAADAHAISQSRREALALQVTAAGKKAEASLAPITDLYEAQAALDHEMLAELAAKAALAQRLEVLRVLLRLPAAPELAPPAETAVKPPEHDKDAWLQLARAHNPSLVQARLAVAEAEAEVATRRSAFLPTLGVEATVQRFRPHVDALPDQTGSVRMTLNVPLYEGGATSSRLRESVQLAVGARAEADLRARKLAEDVGRLFDLCRADTELVAASRRAVATSRVASEAAVKGYDAGLRTIDEVLLAQQRLQAAEQAERQTRHAALLHRLSLEHAAGVLQEKDLREL